ncbi:MAG: DUF4912 domain-containing protein [Termitinemataceae bacterium]
MIENQLTQAYLESLSTSDLIALSEEMGLDLPPDLNRIFIIQELLEAAAVEDEPEEDIEDVETLKTQKLPTQYNKTYIDVLLRDPVWAFVFWEIKPLDREMYEQSPLFTGYQLQVVSLHPGRSVAESDSFYIDVDINDRAWYICFPTGSGWFQVELRLKKGRDSVLLATSRPIKVPSNIQSIRTNQEQVSQNELLVLSGLDDLQITYSNDSQSHTLQQCDF